MIITFGQTLLTFLSALAGAFLAASIAVSHRQLCALISFAAGTLLSVTFFHILPESWGTIPLYSIFIALISGYGLFYVISRYVSHVCPACAASHFEEQTQAQFKSSVTLLAIAFTVHSLMDGIAIALGEHLEEHGHSIFFTITVHKFPEGLALCALLLRAGYDKTKALLSTVLFESSTLIGWVLGAFLLDGIVKSGWLNLILLHIGGGFVYLAFHAILNESEEHSPRFIIIFFLIGLIFIGLVH
jgi:zinc and cadmium transporter